MGKIFGASRSARRAAEQAEKAMQKQKEMAEKERVRMEEENKLSAANLKDKVVTVLKHDDVASDESDVPKKRAKKKASESLGFK